ncbi:hypothetical protein MBOE_00060 [Mycolicibacterium boenickei]|uniref:Uncharacterized protein n=1 Tax=Mycolicibacterium boenickei TaxID=146017 RepID=A0ABM7ING5_9MYCO|nr:hypothetical protein MBOE_00060 [Mycolicibacterium boenickei]
MVGAFVGVLLLVLGIGAVAGVVTAVAMGLPTLAIVIGLISGAFSPDAPFRASAAFAGRSLGLPAGRSPRESPLRIPRRVPASWPG